MKALEIPAIDYMPVKSIFAQLEAGDIDEFLSHVADDVLDHSLLWGDHRRSEGLSRLGAGAEAYR